MLLSREEMSFDFGGARLSPQRDRDLLRFVFSQYLYGEVTGIQVGHWFYAAPDLDAARFLAKQAVEEMQHVGNFLRILGSLGLEPEPPHPLLRFLATGMMGDDWAQHVATEMALGEGFVLTTMYAVADTLDDPDTVAIINRAARQEESHVDFGERRTQALLHDRPELRQRLLGQCLIWLWGVERLGDYLIKHSDGQHPVLQQLPEFTAHTLRCAELRMVRMGLCHVAPLSLPWVTRARLMMTASGQAAFGALTAPLQALRRPRRLTDRYLEDPTLRSLLSTAAGESPRR